MPMSRFWVRKRPQRGLRALRSAAFLGAALAVAALVVRMVGGSDVAGEEPVAVVRFESKLDVIAQRAAKPPPRDAVAAEERAIVGLLSDWYRRAFVDPDLWGDGTFPELAALFETEEGRLSFARDLDSLTIGSLRTDLARVRPRGARVLLTLYYDGERLPYAVASVVFNAAGFFKQEAPVLDIRQKATYYLTKTEEGWRVLAYDAAQKQETPSTLRGAGGDPSHGGDPA